MRVFHDRLIDDFDREYLKAMLKEIIPQFGLTCEEVLCQERIIFGDFWQGRDVEPRHYMQISDLQQLVVKMNEYLEEFNIDPAFSGSGGKNSMKLVLFLDACEHVSRISRILRQPKGNALLLGVGGSGR
jgi:dynein heavy chain